MIDRAVKAHGKPRMALEVTEAMSAPGSPGVPRLLASVVEKVVRLARFGCLLRRPAGREASGEERDGVREPRDVERRSGEPGPAGVVEDGEPAGAPGAEDVRLPVVAQVELSPAVPAVAARRARPRRRRSRATGFIAPTSSDRTTCRTQRSRPNRAIFALWSSRKPFERTPTSPSPAAAARSSSAPSFSRHAFRYRSR